MSAATLFAAPWSAQASTPDGGNVLNAGQCLSASRTQPVAALQSASTRFELVLTTTALYIHNEVLLTETTAAGYTTWKQVANHSGGGTRLCMRTDGNLVLTGNDGVVWSSGTAGTGTHNYAIIRNNGRLVVRTSDDRRVWWTRTSPVLLVAGDRLPSGRTFVNATEPGGVTRLAMRADGDLVLSRGTTTVWHSRTSVENSYMTVTSNGQLVVRSPGGHAIWRSTAVGASPLLTVAVHGRITLESFESGDCWTRPEGTCR